MGGPAHELLRRAHDEAVRMRATLETSLQHLYDERALIGRLDATGIMRSVQERQVGHSRLARSAKAFELAIEEARLAVGAGEPGLGGLFPFAPAEVSSVRGVLEEVTQLAAQVKSEERLQARLIERASACVSGFIGAITPKTMAYDARGMARAARARGRTRQVVV